MWTYCDRFCYSVIEEKENETELLVQPDRIKTPVGTKFLEISTASRISRSLCIGCKISHGLNHS